MGNTNTPAATATHPCAPVATPAPDQLVSLRSKPLGLSYWTLRRWAQEGRLRAFEGQRGRLTAWLSDIAKAVEACPYAPQRRESADTAGDALTDPLDAALASGELTSGQP